MQIRSAKGKTDLGPHAGHTLGAGFDGHGIFHDVDLGLVRCLYSTNEIVDGDHMPMADKAIPPAAIVGFGRSELLLKNRTVT